MMTKYTLGFVLLAAAPVFAQQDKRIEHSFPAFFIHNAGQVEQDIRFIVRAPGLNAGFTATQAIFQLDNLMLSVNFAGANPGVTITGQQPLSGAANFLIGNQPKEWKTNLPTYQKIRGVCS